MKQAASVGKAKVSTTQPVIHIGFHKTGSTWLQTVVFTEENGYVSPWDRGLIMDELIGVDPFRFEPSKAREAFAQGLATAEARSLIPVLSHERLSGDPHFGGYDQREVADRLAAVFPEGRILVVIREQKEMILSCWKQYVAIGGANSLGDYMVPRWIVGRRIPRFDFLQFDYDALIGYYQQRFGRQAVVVLPFELLQRDPSGFVAPIARLVGTGLPSRLDIRPVNASLSGPACAVRRRMNRFLVRSSVNPSAPVYVAGLRGILGKGLQILDPLVPRGLDAAWHRRARALIRRTLGGRYVESNRAAMELTGIDLGAYGYDC